MHAIIGGSGLARIAEMHVKRREVVRTPYGDPSCALSFGEMDEVPLVFLARHGYGHTIAPHEINYRANIWALAHVGVTRIISIAAVGGIRTDLGPGSIALPHQIIDYTWGRASTFYDGPDHPITHVDFTHPYDAGLRDSIARAAQSIGEPIAREATYGCTQGPRLETAAEVERMRRDGCDLVGMTGMPEAVLARELDRPYAALAVVANAAAGIGESADSIRLEAVERTLEAAMVRVRRILSTYLRSV